MGRCCIPYCRGNYDNGPKVRVFSLPRDAARRIVWQRVIPRRDVDINTLRDPKVCELHFKPEYLRTTSRYTSSDGITVEAPMRATRLTEDAVPTIFPNSPAYVHDRAPARNASARKRRRFKASHLEEAAQLSLSTHAEEQRKDEPSSYDGLFLWLPDIQAGKKEPTCCHSHGVLMKNVGTEVSWPSIKKVDARVGASTSICMTKSTQASLPAVKVHRWTETANLGDFGDSDTDAQECLDPSVSGMSRLSSGDQIIGGYKLHSSELDEAGKKEPTCCHSHGVLMKNVGTEVSWPSIKKVDARVGASTSICMTKSTHASLPAVKVHRWTETVDLGDFGDSDTDAQGCLGFGARARSNSHTPVSTAPSTVTASTEGATQQDQTASDTTQLTRRVPPEPRVFRKMQPENATLSNTAPQFIPAELASTNHQVAQRLAANDFARGDSAVPLGTGTVLGEEACSAASAAASTRITYSCSYCSQEFLETQDLTSHVGTCPWPQPHKCPLCSNVCSNWTSMQDHIVTHVKELGMKCPLCERAVAGGKSDMLRHVMRHLTFKPFVCSVCKSSFLNGYDIAAHVCRRAGQRGRWAFPLRTTPTSPASMCRNSC
ncbi:uncharacterized protein LOC119401914 isoform X1 [Rhipicephalus sanguineus]|uniref:uncharacterized protein LOC119401914 isoform X1 n=1 Tax=Rhipicephalus sanguineus TaxID=34632 RepID=UPI0020C4557D|nr:uncharacterized protein LOC119401914 isoform X1 [Rhipicephalus sanguineus]